MGVLGVGNAGGTVSKPDGETPNSTVLESSQVYNIINLEKG